MARGIRIALYRCKDSRRGPTLRRAGQRRPRETDVVDASAREGSMKQIVLTSLIFVAITGSLLPAQSLRRSGLGVMPLRLSVRPDSRLWLEGSSNVRDWRCDATSLDASIDLDDAAYEGAASIDRLRGVQV